MLVWGGTGNGSGDDIGPHTVLEYEPATDTWAEHADAPAEVPFIASEAVWTGDVLVTWGGVVFEGGAGMGAWTKVGGVWNAETDEWTLMTTLDSPSARDGHAMVWSGDHMIVWGGAGAVMLSTGGGRYSPP
jgi:hypothetical protein